VDSSAASAKVSRRATISRRSAPVTADRWRSGRSARASRVGAVCDLADLRQLQHLHIPFDVQTEFYRIRANAPREVARRIGFAEGD